MATDELDDSEPWFIRGHDLYEEAVIFKFHKWWSKVILDQRYLWFKVIHRSGRILVDYKRLLT